MDDVVTAVASALIAKGTDAVVSGASDALGRLIRLVRTRFGRGTREDGVLSAAAARPDDQARRAALIQTLADVMSSDPDFDRAVRSYWREAAVHVEVERAGAVNTFSGTAGKLVQANDIHGNVSL